MGGRVTLGQAQALISVAETHSFDRTAAELEAASPTSVFHLISRMSAAIGRGSLVGASSRGRVALTAVGVEVLPLAQALVDAHAAFEHEHHEIRLSGYPALAGRATKAVSEFDRARPKVEVVFYDISDRSRADRGENLVARAATGEIDLVLAPAGQGVAGLEELSLYAWHLLVVLPEDDYRREYEKISLTELRDLRFLVTPPGHTSRRLFDAAARHFNVRPRVAMELVDQTVMAKIARDSVRYAAIIPDDALATADRTSPCLIGADGNPAGGRYALYYSRRNVQAGEGSRADAVRQLAEVLQTALAQL